MGGWIGEWMDGWMHDAEEEKRAPTRLLAALFFILPATHRTITRTRKSVPVRRNVRRPRRSSESGRSCRHADNPAVCFSDLCVRVYVQMLSLSLSPSIATRERARTRERALVVIAARCRHLVTQSGITTTFSKPSTF